MKIGFDNEKYLKLQSEHILDRISHFGDKLYLEFGGKLYDDYHASRVLPGFQPDSKLRMLMQLADQAEIVIVISADDMERRKIRSDLGISYDAEVLRLKEIFEEKGLYVGSIVVTHYAGQKAADLFIERLKKMDIRVYRHYLIPDYPNDIPFIVSDEGYGKNDYIETSRPLVVVTAPGPGSGKMATCLSQLYQDNKRGIRAGYAKYETFPIWNLPLKHPVNLAYEAATADLNDVNMIDPYHYDAYSITTVNYNRDVEIFPVLKSMFQLIYGDSPYLSPTDMGVNMAGKCIVDDQVCCEASKQEIIRRYFETDSKVFLGRSPASELYKIDLIMSQLGLTPEDRPVVREARAYEQLRQCPCAAMELNDGRMILGRTTDLLGASSALLLNAIKKLADIDDSYLLLSPTSIEPIQNLKIHYLGSKNPRLHTDEVLIALSASASTNEKAALALTMLPLLKGCQVHTTVMLSDEDRRTFRQLGVNLTTDTKTR